MSVELPDAFVEALAERVAPLVASLLGDRLAPGPEPWIGVRAAAEHLGCKPQRVYDLVSRRDDSRIPVKREGSRLLFRRSELDRWVEVGR